MKSIAWKRSSEALARKGNRGRRNGSHCEEHIGDVSSKLTLLLVHSWFDLSYDADTKTSYHMFNGRYWRARLNDEFSQCPDIF